MSGRTKRLIRILVLAAMLVLSLGTLAGSGYWAIATIRFKNSAVRVEGAVVELKRVTRSHTSSGRRRPRTTRTSTTWAPVFEFKDGAGATHRVQSSTSSSPAAYKVGENVPVLYLAEDPQAARIDSFMNLWFGPVLLAGMGMVFALLAGFVFRKHVREAQP
jgi:hypothetical protein